MSVWSDEFETEEMADLGAGRRKIVKIVFKRFVRPGDSIEKTQTEIFRDVAKWCEDMEKEGFRK